MAIKHNLGIRGDFMNSSAEQNIKRTLLKLLFQQGYISEDAYSHSLNNLPKTLDCCTNLGYDVGTKEVKTHGRL